MGFISSRCLLRIRYVCALAYIRIFPMGVTPCLLYKRCRGDEGMLSWSCSPRALLLLVDRHQHAVPCAQLTRMVLNGDGDLAASRSRRRNCCAQCALMFWCA